MMMKKIIKYIPFVGLVITPSKEITALFSLYHLVSFSIIAIFIGLKIALNIYYLNT